MHGIKRSTIQATTSVTRNTLREQGTLLRWCGKDRSRGKFGTKVAGSAMQLIIPTFLKFTLCYFELILYFLHVFAPSRSID